MTKTNEATWLVEEKDPKTDKVLFQRIFTDKQDAEQMYEQLLKNDWNTVSLQKLNKQLLTE